MRVIQERRAELRGGKCGLKHVQGQQGCQELFDLLDDLADAGIVIADLKSTLSCCEHRNRELAIEVKNLRNRIEESLETVLTTEVDPGDERKIVNQCEDDLKGMLGASKAWEVE